jgi:hypothetical protein
MVPRAARAIANRDGKAAIAKADGKATLAQAGA